MHSLIETLELILTYAVEICAIVLELIGVFVLIFNGLKCFIQWIRKDCMACLDLGHGISAALEFLMGGEILHTIIVHTWTDLAILGVIVVLRVAMTFLIHWEIKHEEEAMEKHHGE